MDGHLGSTQAISDLDPNRSLEWMHRVISLVEAALGQLHSQVHPAQSSLLEAASLLRQQVDPAAGRAVPDGRGRLLAWQARKVRDYIDTHITGSVHIADLCALVQRSEAHFSRSFKRTFGESPHAFLVRRRVEFAAHYMVSTDAPLSDIALRCGFTDQAHLCKHFRLAAGHTPAAWRRAHKTHHDEPKAAPSKKSERHPASIDEQRCEAVAILRWSWGVPKSCPHRSGALAQAATEFPALTPTGDFTVLKKKTSSALLSTTERRR
jgi:AraC family transcriptional regulator